MSGTGFTLEVKDGKAILTIDLKNNGGPSKSGKSVVIATSGGNIEIPNSGGAKLGLNVYRPI